MRYTVINHNRIYGSYTPIYGYLKRRFNLKYGGTPKSSILCSDFPFWGYPLRNLHIGRMIIDQWIGSSAAPLGIPHVGVTVESVDRGGYPNSTATTNMGISRRNLGISMINMMKLNMIQSAKMASSPT